MSMTVRGDVRSSSAPATSMPAQKVMIESVNTTEVAERSQPNSASSGFDEQRPGIDEPEEHEQHEGDEEVQQTVRRCVGHGSPLEIAFLMSCQPPSV